MCGWWWGMQVEVGWVGGKAAKDMGFLARWGWRKLGCGRVGSELPSVPSTVAQATAMSPHSV